jgi:hypothetical protein
MLNQKKNNIKLLSIFLSFMIVLLPVCAHAEPPADPGRVTNIEKNQRAPYSGVLLDTTAATGLLVDKKYMRLEIELGLRKEFQQEFANKRLAFDLLEVEHNSLLKYHDSVINFKDQHIVNLDKMLKEEMGNNHTHWWALGGVALGIVLSIGVFYASVEISK